MRTNRKRTLYFLVALAVIAGLLIGANNFLEHKIKKGLEKSLTDSGTSYKKINVSLLGAMAEVEKAEFSKNGRVLKAKLIKLDDLDLWAYLTRKEIIIGELFLNSPDIRITKSEQAAKKDSSSGKLGKKVMIKSLKVKNGQFRLVKSDTSKADQIFVSFPELEMRDINLNQKTLREPVPFDYRGYHFRSDSVYMRMNPQHDIYISNIDANKGALKLQNFKIVPKYNRIEFQKHIPYEKDRVELNISEIHLNDLSWSFRNDSLHFRNPLTRISDAKLRLYRNKLMPKDTRHKPMYSELIRNLPFKLELDSIRIRQSYIQYEELIDTSRQAGMLKFENLNASIYHLSNVGMSEETFPRTDVDVKTSFMGEAPLEVNWNMDVSDLNDRFRISGKMGRLSAAGMNEFLKPAMNIEAKGDIADMSFNYTGNNTVANGKMKLRYYDFKVEVLRKNSEKKNKILSAIANLFVNNEAVNEELVHKNIKVKRDKTKSFWNYFWKCIRAGALKSFL
ncbi:hypothetical protein [Salegentibacter chungangensis]|uniref:DUF748 domain-containing protein n=1 Tax=Salegentibacter chungangensis TaxID=1335724 RepID=A0ABW3NPC4_9FLAO